MCAQRRGCRSRVDPVPRRVCCGEVTLLRALYELFNFVLPVNLRCRCFSYPEFMDEKTGGKERRNSLNLTQLVSSKVKL